GRRDYARRKRPEKGRLNEHSAPSLSIMEVKWRTVKSEERDIPRLTNHVGRSSTAQPPTGGGNHEQTNRTTESNGTDWEHHFCLRCYRWGHSTEPAALSAA